MTEVKPKKLAIIDGKSVFYRGYYAMPNLSTKDGTSTGGVYGFAVMALEVIKRLKPDYVAVAWDKPKTNIRKRLKLYPEYKAGRKPAPPDFYEQIPLLHELLQAFGWPLYELDDYEADDIMGTLAVQATANNIETMLVTSDMDMLQLVDPHVHVYALKTGLSNIELYSPKSFGAKYGIAVEQFLDLKALKGDSSDNIPGVPGIGEKTAVQLLQEFKTLDKIYDNLGLIKDSTRNKLEQGKKLAYLSKELAAIWTDAPLKLNLKEVDGSKVNPEGIQELLQKLEFRTLARQLPEIMHVKPAEHIASSYVQHGPKATHHLVENEAQLLQIPEKFNGVTSLILHSRAAKKHGKEPQLLILSPSPKEVYTLVLSKLSIHQLQAVLQPLLADPNVKKVGFDLKSTLQVGYELGLTINGVAHDVLIGSFLLNSLRREKTLTELAVTDLDYQGPSLDDMDKDELVSMIPQIVSVIRALYDRQATELKADKKLSQLAETIEWPIIPVLAHMEYEGIRLDTSYLTQMESEVDDMISDFEQQIYGHADQEFNISSPAQLADVLFNKLNLPKDGIQKGKTGYSTAASELDKLRGAHPIIDLITQYREVTKLKSTYISTLPKLVDENSRVHTTFNLTIAQTGRLSSTDPNLQNIPVRTELGKKIRTAFVADPEHVFVSADYSQFELRIAAYLCGDEDLIGQFNNDVDVHTATAAQIYGREPEDVTKNMRREAKVVNFGVMYGLSAHGLVSATGMTYQAAKQFIEKYFEVRPKLLGYIESVKEKARNEGYVETLYGRRRPTPDVQSANFAVREAAMRAAVNMPFQGTAADIMKLAMVAVEKKLETIMRHSGGATHGQGQPKLLLQIHDSLIVETTTSQQKKVAELLKNTMEQVVDLPIKLTVDVSTGKNWGEL